MKRFLAVIFTIVILCISLLSVMPAVSAAKYSSWVLGPEGEYLTHEGKMYYPFTDISGNDFFFDYYGSNTVYSNNDYLNVKVIFEDEKTEALFTSESSVLVPTAVDSPCIQVELYTKEEYNCYTLVYVEESHIEEYKNLAKGVGVSYSVQNNYYGTTALSLSDKEYNNWLVGAQITKKSVSLAAFESRTIFALDTSGFVQMNCADVFYDKENEELYLYRYSDLEAGHYLGVNTDITLYKLENDSLKQELIDFFNIEYVDELDWLMPEEDDILSGFVLCGVLFGVLPLLVLAFSIVMLIVVKDKKYYRSFITMIIGSVLVITAGSLIILLLI